MKIKKHPLYGNLMFPSTPLEFAFGLLIIFMLFLFTGCSPKSSGNVLSGTDKIISYPDEANSVVCYRYHYSNVISCVKVK